MANDKKPNLQGRATYDRADDALLAHARRVEQLRAETQQMLAQKPTQASVQPTQTPPKPERK